MSERSSHFRKGTPLTPTERRLASLANRTFLSLWSYPGIHRDNGLGKPGKEVCDLLVVCDQHVLIFSDKDVAYPDTGDRDLDWARWYRRAIKASADQVWGAERWIRNHPERLFLDPGCKQLFPIPLPDADCMTVHRIVVAHDTSGRRRELVGGSGSLIVAPSIEGDQHLLSREAGGQPLAIGRVDTTRGYVHVFDEVSLDIVLSLLDTITDLTTYLVHKEKLVESGRLLMAYGEEDLLAYYLKHVNSRGEHFFKLPPGRGVVLIDEGLHHRFRNSPEYAAKVSADRVSRIWDRIVEEFAQSIQQGTLYQTNDHSVHVQERILRVLAREPRVRRRMLARSMAAKLAETEPDALGVRTIEPSRPGDPYYVFVCVPQNWGGDAQEYRSKRASFLRAYSSIVMLTYENAQNVVGIGTETGLRNPTRSHDLTLMDRDRWTDADAAEAKKLQDETGFLKKVRRLQFSEPEYPVERFSPTRKIGRNERCPCGSGKKYKKCCLT